MFCKRSETWGRGRLWRCPSLSCRTSRRIDAARASGPASTNSNARFQVEAHDVQRPPDAGLGLAQKQNSLADRHIDDALEQFGGAWRREGAVPQVDAKSDILTWARDEQHPSAERERARPSRRFQAFACRDRRGTGPETLEADSVTSALGWITCVRTRHLMRRWWMEAVRSGLQPRPPNAPSAALNAGPC